mgnify:CR=1 FL=1
MSRAPLTSHVLNLYTGKPAVGLTVELVNASGDSMATGVTDDDGRVENWSSRFELPKGSYSLRFATGAWFEAQREKTFYPSVCIEFFVSDTNHYHVPLLLSPYGYSTYRGS